MAEGRTRSLIGPVARGGVLLAGIVLSGWLFIGALGTLISLQRVGVRLAADFGVTASAGVLGYLFVSLLIRLIRRDLTIPPWHRLARNGLISYGRGWLIGIGAFAVLMIADAARSFGAPSPNGSYVADGIFFAVGILVFAFPGLVMLTIAKHLPGAHGKQG